MKMLFMMNGGLDILIFKWIGNFLFVVGLYDVRSYFIDFWGRKMLIVLVVLGFLFFYIDRFEKWVYRCNCLLRCYWS